MTALLTNLILLFLIADITFAACKSLAVWCWARLRPSSE